jgi:hypothetical protein
LCLFVWVRDPCFQSKGFLFSKKFLDHFKTKKTTLKFRVVFFVLKSNKQSYQFNYWLFPFGEVKIVGAAEGTASDCTAFLFTVPTTLSTLFTSEPSLV